MANRFGRAHQSKPATFYVICIHLSMVFFLFGLQKGKQNMYSLGKYFRERYSGFLPELYFASDLDVQSPNADACLMSAAVLLAGLYPPHKYQIWNPTILWQPIPVKGISAETDMVLKNSLELSFI